MVNFRKVCAVALATTMVSQMVPLIPLAETEIKDYLNPTLSELVENDYIVYFANCGTQKPNELNGGDKTGLYQGNVDQEYGIDEKTGLEWGYISDSPYSLVVPRNNDSTVKTETFLYQDPKIEYDKEKSGIFYNFEIPEGQDANDYQCKYIGANVQAEMVQAKHGVFEQHWNISPNAEIIYNTLKEISDKEGN